MTPLLNAERLNTSFTTVKVRTEKTHWRRNEWGSGHFWHTYNRVTSTFVNLLFKIKKLGKRIWDDMCWHDVETWRLNIDPLWKKMSYYIIAQLSTIIRLDTNKWAILRNLFCRIVRLHSLLSLQLFYLFFQKYLHPKTKKQSGMSLLIGIFFVFIKERLPRVF